MRSDAALDLAHNPSIASTFMPIVVSELSGVIPSSAHKKTKSEIIPIS